MMFQSKLLSHNERLLKSIFNHIDICDATSYKAPEKLKENYEGNSGNGSNGQGSSDKATGEIKVSLVPKTDRKKTQSELETQVRNFGKNVN